MLICLFPHVYMCIYACKVDQEHSFSANSVFCQFKTSSKYKKWEWCNVSCVLLRIETISDIMKGNFSLCLNLFIYLCLPFQLGKCGFLKRVEHLRCRESSLSIRSVLQVQKGRKERKDEGQWGSVHLGSCRSFGKWWCGKGVGWGGGQVIDHVSAWCLGQLNLTWQTAPLENG